jgi:hypothetical protein
MAKPLDNPYFRGTRIMLNLDDFAMSNGQPDIPTNNGYYPQSVPLHPYHLSGAILYLSV